MSIEDIIRGAETKLKKQKEQVTETENDYYNDAYLAVLDWKVNGGKLNDNIMNQYPELMDAELYETVDDRGITFQSLRIKNE